MEQEELGTEKRKSLDVLFKRFNAAIKIQRVYASDHPMCVEAAAELFNTLTTYFTTYPGLIFNVGKTSLTLDGREFTERDAGFYQALANYLHARQIIMMEIRPELKQRELELFLGAISADAEDIRRKGGIENVLGEHQVLNIIAKRLMVEAGDEAVSEAAAAYGEVLNDQEVFLALRESEITPAEQEKLVMNLRQGPMEVAKLLNKLSDRAASTEGETTIEARAGYLTEVIEKLSAMLKEARPEDRQDILQNLAGGVTNLREDLQAPLLEQLKEKLGGIEFGPELMNVVNEALKNADVPMASEIQDISLAEIEDIKLSPEEVYFEFAHLYDDAHVAFEATVEEEIAELEESDVEEQAIDTLLEMLTNSTDDVRLIRTLGGIDLHLHDLIDEERLDLAVKIIQAIRVKRDQAVRELPEMLEMLDQSLSKAARADNVRKILFVALKSTDEENKKYARASLDLLGELAVPTMLDLLVVEADPDQQTKICRVAAHLTQGDLDIFKEKLIDPNWQTVKCIVSVLSNLGDERAVELFKMTVAHSHPEVREATVLALSSFRSPEAVRLTMTAVDDADMSIRKRAVKSLGRMRAEAAISKLTGILEQRDLLNKNLDTRLAVIETLGRIESVKALPVLQRIAKKRIVLFRGPGKKTRAAALEAVKRINQAEEARSDGEPSD